VALSRFTDEQARKSALEYGMAPETTNLLVELGAAYKQK
jgi:hypothetical protein